MFMPPSKIHRLLPRVRLVLFDLMKTDVDEKEQFLATLRQLTGLQQLVLSTQFNTLITLKIDGPYRITVNRVQIGCSLTLRVTNVRINIISRTTDAIQYNDLVHIFKSMCDIHKAYSIAKHPGSLQYLGGTDKVLTSDTSRVCIYYAFPTIADLRRMGAM